jgi:hypothetical protein
MLSVMGEGRRQRRRRAEEASETEASSPNRRPFEADDAPARGSPMMFSQHWQPLTKRSQSSTTLLEPLDICLPSNTAAIRTRWFDELMFYNLVGHKTDDADSSAPCSLRRWRHFVFISIRC